MRDGMDMIVQKNMWEMYTSAWSEPDAAKRLELFEKSLSPHCDYADPLIQTGGYRALSGYMAELQKNVPGIKFVTTAFKTHHNRSLAHWNMVDGNGNLLAPGISFLNHSVDGRLVEMSGFFDPPSAI
jgi:hypothetical protein